MRNKITSFLLSKIADFKYLKENFDSYNSDKISELAIDTAIEIVNKLRSADIEDVFVFPMRDGGIQFEISRISDIDEELVIDKKGNIKLIEYSLTGDILSKNPIKIEQIPSFFI